MRYQLRHAPGLRRDCIGAPVASLGPSSIARMPMAALFSLITLAFAGIAFWSATAHQWVIAAAAAALTAWMGSLTWTAVRKSRP